MLKDIIRERGAIPLPEYMAACLYDPRHGYYRTRDPLGANGDFTTAPEVSQLFGEMVAAWLMMQWQAIGGPKETALVELGPGRGTLMADMLRTIKASLPECYASLAVHMVEISPVLMGKQKDALRDFDRQVQWHPDITTLPELPMLLVANEFFDALPIRQYRKTEDSWEEKAVGLKEEKLAWVWVPSDVTNELPAAVFETSPASLTIMKSLARHIAKHGGAGLIIDYGYTAGNADTFQALKTHRFADPLAAPGEADLTAHVDFAALKAAAELAGARCYGAVTQGELLQQLGITLRAGMLCRNVSAEQRQAILAGLERLILPEAMGTLFKCLAVLPPDSPQPYGF